VTAPLAGKLAVVTGASRGIGRAVANALHAAGCHVVRLARTLAEQAGERLTDLSCDVCDAASVARAAGKVLAQHGPPDLLVNAAGSFLLKPLAETNAEEFAGQLATNLSGPFAVLRAFTGPMIARGSGLIVTIGSIADHATFPGNAAYSASKYGLRGLHGVLAAELAGTGVRATLLSPGPVDTSLWDQVDLSRPGFTQRAGMLRAADVAEAVVFLATRPEHVAVPELHIEPRR